MDTIEFYDTKDKYGYMSNFYHDPEFKLRLPLVFCEKPGPKNPIISWYTSEHYFQAQKFILAMSGCKPLIRRRRHLIYSLLIFLNKSPHLAASMGRQKTHRFNHRIKVPVGLRDEVLPLLSHVIDSEIDWDNVRVNSIITTYLAQGVQMFPAWNNVRDDVMRFVVTAKFQQNKDIQSKLIATKHAKLVEHTSKDRYWGDGGDGTGHNMLGNILMEVRKGLLQKN